MQRIQPVLASIAVFVGTALVMAWGQPNAERNGLLDVLQPRMAVSLKEAAGRFEIGILEGVAAPLGHEILAVGPDYIVVRDVAGVTQRHIPVYSLSCITTTKMRP